MVTRSTPGTRRAFAGAAPSMHEADRRIQSRIANVVSHLISELCLSHYAENGEPGLGDEEPLGETVVVIL